MLQTNEKEVLPMLPEKVGLVALDLDGTLLRSDGSVSEASVEAVRLASARGVKIVIASARAPRDTKRVYQKLGLDTIQITHNGALIHDPVSSNALYHKTMDGSMIRRVIQRAREIEPLITVAVEQMDQITVDRVNGESLVKARLPAAPDNIARVDARLDQPVTKVMMFGQPAPLCKIEVMMQHDFKDEVSQSFTDMHMLTVNHPKVDKGYALAKVAKFYGVDQGSVMAIGDAPNDLGMLKWAGVKISLNNGWPAARRAADILVPSNDDDGVAFAIKKYVLS